MTKQGNRHTPSSHHTDTQHVEYLILGAGASGLSASYHIGHQRCLILEKTDRLYGHCNSEKIHGYTWDQGPHVSFTKHTYVRRLFEKSVGGDIQEFPVLAKSFFNGGFIDHPAQSNLYQLQSEIREKCARDFRKARQNPLSSITNYQEWIEHAFGKAFADYFTAKYTRKYWKTDPKHMDIDWIGNRVFFPSEEEFEASLIRPPSKPTHYISTVRYPSHGGYEAFLAYLGNQANVKKNANVQSVDLSKKCVTYLLNGKISQISYDKLISTLPLPIFLAKLNHLPEEIRVAANTLKCTELYLVNIELCGEPEIDGNWFYIHDEDKLSTRIHYTSKLSPNNTPTGNTALQVEVYKHPFENLKQSNEEIKNTVLRECQEMGFINNRPAKDDEGYAYPKRHFIKHVRYANVICDLERRNALETIFKFLSVQGLSRSNGDTSPIPDWSNRKSVTPGCLYLAGRFGEWRYYWSDDCILRGKSIAETESQ